jgi:inosine/xanthosine triphosphate pyrophosphatase family protein
MENYLNFFAVGQALTSAQSCRKWFYSALGNDGLCRLLASYEDKSASSVCTYAFSPGPGAEPVLFQGRIEGRIVTPRGTNGFGERLMWKKILCFW